MTGSTQTPETFEALILERARAIADHLASRFDIDSTSDVQSAAIFLGQFELPVYGFFPPLPVKAGVPRPQGKLSHDRTRVYETGPSSATANRRGVIARLNGSADYEAFQGEDTRFGCYSAAHRRKGSNAQVARYQAMTVECDNHLDGSQFTDIAKVHAQIVEEALPTFTAVLKEAGLDDMLLAVLHSGGKSIHFHLGSYGTTDKAEHERLVGIIRRLAATVFASFDLAIDEAALRPAQAVRVPGLNLFGRDQKIVTLPNLIYPKKDAAYFLERYALSPVGRADAMLGANRPTTPAFRILKDEAPALWGVLEQAAARLNAVEAAPPVLDEKAQRKAAIAIAKVAAHVGSFVATDGSLSNVDVTAETSPLTQLLQRIRNSMKIRQPKGVIAQQSAEKTSRANKPVRRLDYDRATGKVTFNDPPRPSDLVKVKGTLMTFGDLAAKLTLDYLAAKSHLRVSCTDIGDEQGVENAYVYFDTYRGHLIHSSPDGSTLTPVLLPISDAYVTMALPDAPVVEFSEERVYAEGKAHIVLAKPGTGKTNAAVKSITDLFARKPEASVLVMAPNIALTDALARRISRQVPAARVVHYKDDQAKANDFMTDVRGTVIVSSFHSAKRFKSRYVDYDLVILDEAGTALGMLDQPSYGGVWRSDSEPIEAFGVLGYFARHARTFVMIEATPTAPLGVYAQTLAKEYGRAKDIVIHVTSNGAGTGKTFVPLRDHIATTYLQDCLKAGVPVIAQLQNKAVSTNSHARIATPTRSGYGASSLETGHYLINSDTTRRASTLLNFSEQVLGYRPRDTQTVDTDGAPLSKEMQALRKKFAKVTSSDIHAGYDFTTKKAPSRVKSVIATTSLAAGISLVNQFEVALVCAVSTGVPVTTTIQGLYRERNPGVIVFGYGAVTAERERALTASGADTLRKSSSAFDKVRAAVMLETSQAPHTYQRVLHYATDEGFNVLSSDEALEFAMKRHIPDFTSRADMMKRTKGRGGSSEWDIVARRFVSIAQQEHEILCKPPVDYVTYGHKDPHTYLAAALTATYQTVASSGTSLGAALETMRPEFHRYLTENPGSVELALGAFHALRRTLDPRAEWTIASGAPGMNALAEIAELAGVPLMGVIARICIAAKQYKVTDKKETTFVVACPDVDRVETITQQMKALSLIPPGGVEPPELSKLKELVGEVASARIQLRPKNWLAVTLSTLLGVKAKVRVNSGKMTVQLRREDLVAAISVFMAATLRIDGKFLIESLNLKEDSEADFTPVRESSQVAAQVRSAMKGRIKENVIVTQEADGQKTYEKCQPVVTTRDEMLARREEGKSILASKHCFVSSAGVQLENFHLDDIPAVFRPVVTMRDPFTGLVEVVAVASASEYEALVADMNARVGKARWNRGLATCKYRKAKVPPEVGRVPISA